MANGKRIQVRQISASTSEAAPGQQRVLIDTPGARGGADSGPMGGEPFLAAAGGCFMSNLLAAIRAREASIPGVSTEVIGTITVSPARFERVELLITADCRDRELFEHLVEIADRACIMMIPFAGSSTFKFGLVGPSEFPKLSV